MIRSEAEEEEDAMAWLGLAWLGSLASCRCWSVWSVGWGFVIALSGVAPQV